MSTSKPLRKNNMQHKPLSPRRHIRKRRVVISPDQLQRMIALHAAGQAIVIEV